MADPEDRDNSNSVDAYYAQLETSEFQDVALDTGLLIAMVNLAYFVIFQLGTDDLTLALTTAFVFLPLHAANHAFHYLKSVKKRALRQYFFMAMSGISAIQVCFYMSRLGLESGFLMMLLTAIIYPANAVNYAEENFYMVSGAMGLFMGGTCCLYVYMNGIYGDVEATDGFYAAPQYKRLSPVLNTMLASINFMVSFFVLMQVTQHHMDTFYRMKRLEAALKIK